MSMPSDFKNEVFRDGDWVLFRDYLRAWEPIVTLSHDCHGRPDGWKQITGRQNRKHRTCSSCGERIPEKLQGLIALANWGTGI